MTHVVPGGTITDAWLGAVSHLRSIGREEFDLVVQIDDPAPDGADPAVVAELDHLLASKGLQSVTTVANTIFPSQLARTSVTPARLYERYLRILPRLRGQSKNAKGTYFGRLIALPLGEGRATPVNQLDLIIQDLRTELGHRLEGKPAMRHIYEAQIHIPGKDRRPLGFPCMSSLSFHLDRDRLRLTATYRNQYYIERALGNFLGLAELQRFVADTVGLRQGPLVVHAFHGEIERRVSLRQVDTLIRACQADTRLRLVKARPA